MAAKRTQQCVASLHDNAVGVAVGSHGGVGGLSAGVHFEGWIEKLKALEWLVMNGW